MPSITIDNQEYDLDKLSDAAKAQIQSLQIIDAELRHLQVQVSIANTAKAVHSNLLKEALEAKG